MCWLEAGGRRPCALGQRPFSRDCTNPLTLRMVGRNAGTSCSSQRSGIIDDANPSDATDERRMSKRFGAMFLFGVMSEPSLLDTSTVLLQPHVDGTINSGLLCSVKNANHAVSICKGVGRKAGRNHLAKVEGHGSKSRRPLEKAQVEAVRGVEIGPPRRARGLLVAARGSLVASESSTSHAFPESVNRVATDRIAQNQRGPRDEFGGWAESALCTEG